MSVPALTILRIYDSLEGRAGSPTERIRALQCQTRKDRTPAGDIAVMLSFAFLSVFISIYVVWNLASVWVSVIFVLILCSC